MEYQTAAEGSKELKAKLKAKWPTVKWSVTSDSYSMGSSITVRWENGPIEKQVKVVASHYENVRRDESGEILGGGNQFLHLYRSHSERLKRYAVLRFANYNVDKYERERLENEVQHHTEVRPDGQLIEWDPFARFTPPEPTPAPTLRVVQ